MPGGLLALLVTASACSVADAAAPLRVSLTVTPRVLPPNGGTVTVAGRVEHASTCIVHAIAAPLKVDCTSGRFEVRRRVSANGANSPRLYRPYLEARRGRLKVRSRQSEVEVLGRSESRPQVDGLDACSAGPFCDYGAAYEEFETWGNSLQAGVNDCTFAAAADWEEIVFGWHPYASVLGEEFAQAGGDPRAGLAQSTFFSYWEHEGIAGSHLTGLHPLAMNPEAVRGGVRAHRALMVQFRFHGEASLAQYVAEPGLHDAVVTGFTPLGPLVVTWGETLKASWPEWERDAIGLWAVEATNPST